MKTNKILALLGIGLLATHGAFAAQDAVDVLIQRLVEKNVLAPSDADDIRAEIAQIEKEQAAKAAVEPKKAAPTVAVKSPVKLSGYIQERYVGSNQAGFNDGLDARRVRFTFTGQATPKWDFKTHFDLAGSRKGQTGATSTALFSKPLLLDAVAGLKLNPRSRLQIGQFKVPFGSENAASGNDFELINRSTVTEALVPGRDIGANGRDIGIQLGGSATAGRNSGQVEYALGVFNGAGINTGDDNDGKDVAGRLAWRPALPGLTLGADLYDGRKGANNTARDRQGVDVLFQRAPWFARAEHIWAKDGSVKKRGYYGTLGYTVAPQTQAAIRYDHLDPDTGESGDASHTLTVGFTRLLSKDGLQRWQLNYERRREEGAQVKNDQYLAQLQLGF
jgi:phosphate-selective porin